MRITTSCFRKRYKEPAAVRLPKLCESIRLQCGKRLEAGKRMDRKLPG